MKETTNDAPKTLRNPKGQALTWQRKVEFVRSGVYPRVMPPSGDELRPALEMTDEQLAEALRPVVLRDGHEYVGEASAKAVARLRRADRYQRTCSVSPLPRAQSERLGANVVRPWSGVIGVENRVVRRDNTDYPWSTITYLPRNSGGYAGSGTMIGASTCLTAAHVVHNGTNWLELPQVAPGADYQDPTSFPFGQFGCYTVSIPTAFINNNGGDARFDYAVIEFAGCGDFPGRATGWKGVWEAPDSVITDNLVYLYGHPSDRMQPQIWGNEGDGILNGDYINFFMDAWFGDSGAGLYVYDTDGWPYIVGVLRGPTGALGDDSRPNFGRRITREVIDFIVANSEL